MAEWKDVPLIGPANENIDDVQVDQWASTLIDGIPLVVEGKLQIVKRPGLTEYINLGTGLPIDGLYWWDKQRCVLAVSAGRVWKITDSAGTRAEITGSTALRSSQLVSFANDATKCVMANGGQMVHTDLTTLTTMADGDAPTAVTHVAELDGYVLANEVDTGRVHYSDIDDLTGWQALAFWTAESKTDDVVAVKEAFREICALGRETVEFWVNDGVAPFARIPGSAQPYGTEAPQSLAQVGSNWMWLAHTRRLVTMQGRQVVEVSSPYDRVIQRYTSVSDAIGYTVSIDGHPIYLLNFPSAKETLAYNYQTQQWHKWGYWDTTRGEYQRYRGQVYCHARSWNQHLVGDHSNGIIYKADRAVYTDNGNPIRTLLRTGHVSHGAEFTKRSDNFRIRCKRGAANSAVSDPQVMMRQRSDNKAQWSNERWKSLGQAGEHEVHLDWRRNGIYKTCQREIVHSDATDFVLMGAQEYLTVLGR